jgi:hypothetical protein
MGYTFTCDKCGVGYDRTPPFMGEFNESFLKTSDSILTELFAPGQTVTVCRGCAEELFA